jgi:hypothetical protein
VKIRRLGIALLVNVLFVGFHSSHVSASTLELVVAEDKTTGYNRSFFKHWIDADKDGCNTRAEVLIEEAIVKPKIGPKCKLTGGEWVSAYDGKKVTNSSQLDVDHLVPLAEAWRSGAWKWTAAQRQAYANDLDNSETLIAVTLTTNRSKGDKDPSLWIPSKDECAYTENWVAVKNKYSLTYDEKEAAKLVSVLNGCGRNATSFNPISIPEAPNPIVTYSNVTYFGEPFVLAKIQAPTPIENSNPRKYQSGISVASNSSLVVPGRIIIKCFRGPYDENTVNDKFASGIYVPSGKNTELYLVISANQNLVSCLLTPTLTFNISITFRANGNLNGDYLKQSAKFEILATAPAPTPAPTPTPTPVSIVTPGAFCSPAGAIGNSTSGLTYTCKTSSTDTRNRWRQ